MDICCFCKQPFEPNQGGNGTFACCPAPPEYRAEVERIQKIQREKRREELKREIARLERELAHINSFDAPRAEPQGEVMQQAMAMVKADVEKPKKPKAKRDKNGFPIV